MGGRPYPRCSFCRKTFDHGANIADHERHCVMLEHGRYIPRDIPIIVEPR